MLWSVTVVGKQGMSYREIMKLTQEIFSDELGENKSTFFGG